MNVVVNADGSVTLDITATEAARFNVLIAAVPGSNAARGSGLGPPTGFVARAGMTISAAAAKRLADYLHWSEGTDLLEITDEAASTRDVFEGRVRLKHGPRLVDRLCAVLGLEYP